MHMQATELTGALIQARRQHPAWQLLASHRAPLLLSCLQHLFKVPMHAVPFEQALQVLATLLQQHASQREFAIADGDHLSQSRRELRTWIRRALIFERDGYLYATDALTAALRFVDGLEHRILTSTASRLSLVQRAIESLSEKINPDPQVRARSDRRRIEELQQELQDLEAGRVNVLSAAEAVEGLRDLFRLASELKADFRRVEESWRKHGMQLRQTVADAGHHRGLVIDDLLSSSTDLLDTPEGRAFDGFHQQLAQHSELDHMHQRLRSILRHPAVAEALTASQQQELKWLVPQLTRESQAVLEARTRIEREVRGYLRADLAMEHRRVGALLKDCLATALKLDWDRERRRADSPLPPIGLPISGIPLPERLLFKAPCDDPYLGLNLDRQAADLGRAEADFWDALDALDHAALLQRTREVLRNAEAPMSISQLARTILPTHDIEHIAWWLSMALQGHASILNDTESFEAFSGDDHIRVVVPKVELLGVHLENVEEAV